VTPFACLTKKDQPFSYAVEVDNCFQTLKASSTIAPLFIHINPSKHYLGNERFSQLGKIFHFHKFSPMEINYKIHDKELLAITDAFEDWHHFLRRTQHEIIMIPNDTTFLCQIHEDLNKNVFIIGIQGQLRNHHQDQDFSNDHVKFEFQNGLLY
jgi:hypothetical protein